MELAPRPGAPTWLLDLHKRNKEAAALLATVQKHYAQLCAALLESPLRKGAVIGGGKMEGAELKGLASEEKELSQLIASLQAQLIALETAHGGSLLPARRQKIQ